MKLQTLMLCLLALFAGTIAHGQQADVAQPISANEAMEVLKNGTLVVRLSTNVRKIAALEKMVANTTREKDRQRFEKMLAETQEDTRNHNLWLMEAFQKNYTFSKLLFMPDTAAISLKGGVRKGIFYSPELQIDPSLSLESDFLVAFNGNNTSDQKTGNEGINVLDQNMQTLSAPFPFFTGRTSIRRMFEETFNKTTELDHYKQLVMKFQQKLVEFGG
ncbi:MAG: hypothetical protein K9J37_22305 [Saprospiraceae bacterium]|nr:hypothetical protein [Saprospiraceae bacterium]MCF8252656.1 hypothetical protein [Saprospiraceae bacterium]MCF8282855.1 hypothetical protein [Bacteroidales bacterium]MCF8314228.1 hypothetical protein [Saprospiraceae bacterium]MCF8443053.1 hypothetical protein [Saprospiraceae bacterium]